MSVRNEQGWHPPRMPAGCPSHLVRHGWTRRRDLGPTRTWPRSHGPDARVDTGLWDLTGYGRGDIRFCECHTGRDRARLGATPGWLGATENYLDETEANWSDKSRWLVGISCFTRA